MAKEKDLYAQAIRACGCQIETLVAYKDEKQVLEGFTAVNYFRLRRPYWLFKVLFHLKIAQVMLSSEWDVIIFGYYAAHLIPISFWNRRFRGLKTKHVLDLRTVPVDLDNSWESLFNVIRFRLALKMGNLFCDGMTFVTSFLRDTLRPQLPRVSSKMHVVTTAADFSRFDPSKARIIRKELGINGKFVLIYHGVLSPNRGLQNVLSAIPRAIKDIPNLLFLIVGVGAAEAELKGLVKELGIEEHVLFTGRIPFEEIPNYIKSADLGIIPLPDIDWWNLNSPIKLKEYIAMELPAMVTDIQSHRQVAEKTGGVLFFKDDGPETIARVLIDYYRERKLTYPQKARANLVSLISYRAEMSRLVTFLHSLRTSNDRDF